MKEVLGLENVSRYLPYGVGIYGSSELWTLKGIDRVVDGEIFVNLSGVTYYKGASMHEHSLMLRPMSDLVKEIEVDGENLIPVEYISGNWDLGDLDWVLTECSNGKQLERLMDLSHSVIEQLIKWHFDVNGLIEKGLAVNANTLQS